MLKKILVTSFILILFAGIVFTGAESDAEKAKCLAKKAVEYLKENGKQKAIEEFSNEEGEFVDASFYVFAYNIDGVMVAHPYRSDLIGKNLLDKTDSKGKLFRKEIIETAKKDGSGWVDYYYVNPETGREMQKSTYFEKADDLVICCGIYK